LLLYFLLATLDELWSITSFLAWLFLEMKYAVIFSLAAALPAVFGIAFEGPIPTAINPERALMGTSPKPTTAPSVNELRKRQSSSSPATCGWVDGDFGMLPDPRVDLNG
jgi:hypothetical protein